MQTSSSAQPTLSAGDYVTPLALPSPLSKGGRRLRLRIAGAALAAAAALTAGVGAASSASAAGYVPCPSGHACLYDTSPQTGGYQDFYHYGSYNLSNVTGSHRFTNAQTGAAKAYLCTGYNGTGTCQLVPAGTTITRDFGPINSVYLSA